MGYLFLRATFLLAQRTPQKLVKNRDLGYYKPGRGTKRGLEPGGLTADTTLLQ